MNIQHFSDSGIDSNVFADATELHILPTDMLISRLLQCAQGMQNHDYDVEEMVSICLQALTEIHMYPSSFESEVKLPPQPQTGYDVHDYNIVHDMLRMTYDTLYFAIRGTGLYGETGLLKCNCFFIYQQDVVLFSVG